MIERLFVVIGAGASRGCAPDVVPTEIVWTPPLVTDLFRPALTELHLPNAASAILEKYPLAKLAAADLRGRDDSLAIEEVIRTRYRDSDKSLDQRIFRAIPPYLQDLLHAVSYSYTKFPQNYESLVTNLLRLGEVVFISLNYDVLLDNVLMSADPLATSMEWYIRSTRRWSLIKLHGSVNWARRTGANDANVFVDPPADLQLDDEIVLRTSSALPLIRGFTGIGPGFRHGELHYPVLSVPVGQADELACPDSHVDFLRAKLEETQPLHVLLIGYSGNDQEVLSLIRNSGRGVKTLTIVDHNLEAATAVVGRLAEAHGLFAEEINPYDGDFNGWVESGSLSRFVEDMTIRPF